VRFERTDPFKADYQRLSEDERQKFDEAARAFNAGCDRFVETKDPSSWPGSLRVKPVENAPGIFAMTWSFSGPDGRATWQWTTTVDEIATSPEDVDQALGCVTRSLHFA